jgi:hypothetical protein
MATVIELAQSLIQEIARHLIQNPKRAVDLEPYIAFFEDYLDYTPNKLLQDIVYAVRKRLPMQLLTEETSPPEISWDRILAFLQAEFEKWVGGQIVSKISMNEGGNIEGILNWGLRQCLAPRVIEISGEAGIDRVENSFDSSYRVRCKFWVPNLLEYLTSSRLYMLMGPTNIGKSFFLLQTAIEAAKQGLRVTYLTLENDIAETMARTLSYLSGEEINHFYRIDSETRKKYIRQYYTPLPITIVWASSITIGQIVSSYGDTDFLAIDYLDKISVDTVRYKDRRFELQYFTNELYNLAKSRDLILFTLTQTNRAGYNTADVGLEHVGEDWQKVVEADYVFVMQPIKNSDFILLKLPKARGSAKHLGGIQLRPDFAHARLEVCNTVNRVELSNLLGKE